MELKFTVHKLDPQTLEARGLGQVCTIPIERIRGKERLASLPDTFIVHERLEPTIPYKIYGKITAIDGRVLEEESNCCYPDCGNLVCALLMFIILSPLTPLLWLCSWPWCTLKGE